MKSVLDPSFKKYGKVVNGYDTALLTQEMEKTSLPDGVAYVPSVASLEATPFAKQIQERFFGGLPVQVGYCNGHNLLLNAVEYHRSSEINVAVTAMILLVGKEEDIQADYTYDTSLIEAFYVPQGTVVEMYATTLHYAPCQAEDGGFRCTVVLPKDTNLDLEVLPEKKEEDALLFARNKWLIAHAEAGLEKDGAFVGLKGKNVSVSDFE